MLIQSNASTTYLPSSTYSHSLPSTAFTTNYNCTVMSTPIFQTTKLASIYSRPAFACQYAAARQRVFAIRNGLVAPSRRRFVQTSSQGRCGVGGGLGLSGKGGFLAGKGSLVGRVEGRRRGYKTVQEMRSRYKFGVCKPLNHLLLSSHSQANM